MFVHRLALMWSRSPFASLSLWQILNAPNAVKPLSPKSADGGLEDGRGGRKKKVEVSDRQAHL